MTVMHSDKMYIGHLFRYRQFRLEVTHACLEVNFEGEKTGLPLGEFVRVNKQKANVIGW